MKKFLLFVLIFPLFFSCKKETYINNTELWLKVSNPTIENLDVSFVGKNVKNKLHTYAVNYVKGVFTPTIKQVNDNKEGGIWTLVYFSLEESDGITFSYNGKEFKTRGFFRGERRFIEVLLTPKGDLSGTDYDISQIDRIIYID